MGGHLSQPDGSLPARLRAHLDRPGRAGRPLMVALSGGRDSMVLLHLLRFPLRDLCDDLSAAHVDHAMRPGSDADARWVRGVCRAWDVPLQATRLDPPASSEADARRRRYAFLGDAADPDTLVLTAHHQDDQAETVLFRAARGTGVRGLRGIAPRRGRIVRPLLSFRRGELARYAEETGLAWRDDPTNRDPSYARNRIRHRVIPALEDARPGAARNLARLADRARATERALDAALRRLEEEATITDDGAVVTLARPVLLSYDPALRARLVRRVLRRFGSTPDRAGTQAALEFISSGPSGGEAHVAGGLRIERDFDRIRVLRAGRDGPGTAPDEPLVIQDGAPGMGRARIGGREVAVAWGVGTRIEGGRRAGIDHPVFPLTVRGWQPGDRIRLPFGSKKLKKLFGEQRLGRRARRQVPVVVDGQGRIVWAVGVARAESVVEQSEDFEIAVGDAG